MYQKHELNADLSPEDISSTLKACGLPEKDEYTEDEADRFKECRSSIEQRKTYKQAEADFRRKSIKAKPLSNEPEAEIQLLSITELLAIASEQVGTRISLTEVVQILDICGLPDKDEYTSSEGNRFLEACKLLKQQNKSYKEIAAHFGMNDESDPDNLQQIVGQISDSTVSAESGLVHLVDKVTEKRAAAIPGLVNKLYLKNVSRKLVESQINTEIFFAQLEERIMAQIEGKSPAHSLEATWEWETNSLPPSSPKPMSLSEGSDNGMSNELHNE